MDLKIVYSKTYIAPWVVISGTKVRAAFMEEADALQWIADKRAAK